MTPKGQKESPAMRQAYRMPARIEIKFYAAGSLPEKDMRNSLKIMKQQGRKMGEICLDFFMPDSLF
ncbi:MAG: hypothetical protein WCD70_16945 [Alphaproteobacteria bacterium]